MTNTYQVTVELMKPSRIHWGSFKVQAETMEDATVKMNHFCEVLLHNSVPKSCYEIRWEFDGVGQGHYITDWSKALPPKEISESEKMVNCPKCEGHGNTSEFDGHHYRDAECTICEGEGRITADQEYELFKIAE